MSPGLKTRPRFPLHTQSIVQRIDFLRDPQPSLQKKIGVDDVADKKNRILINVIYQMAQWLDF